MQSCNFPPTVLIPQLRKNVCTITGSDQKINLLFLLIAFMYFPVLVLSQLTNAENSKYMYASLIYKLLFYDK